MLLFLLLITEVSACFFDVDCRNASNCNAVCDNRTNVCFNALTNVVTCNATASICYPALGLCFPRCYGNSDCLPTVLHHPNTGVCHIATGRCYDCLTTADCVPNRDSSCNADCSYNQRTDEFLCFNGSVCAKQHRCIADLNASINGDVFVCVFSGSDQAFALNIMLLVVLFLLF